MSEELRIEPDESTDQVVAKLLAVKDDPSIVSLCLGHQQYVLEDKGKTILNALGDVIIDTYPNRKWQRLVFEFSYFITTDKEQGRFSKADVKFKRALSEFGRRLQLSLDLDQEDLGLEGSRERVETAIVGKGQGTEITGNGMIVFKKNVS